MSTALALMHAAMAFDRLAFVRLSRHRINLRNVRFSVVFHDSFVDAIAPCSTSQDCPSDGLVWCQYNKTFFDVAAAISWSVFLATLICEGGARLIRKY